MAAVTSDTFFANDPVRLDIAFGSPEPQRRSTVALRILLIVPQIIAVVVLGLVSIVLVVIGWFAALVLGRLPRWIAVYETGWIAYSIRVNAYAYLLLDDYPPFSFAAPDYPIAVEIGASHLSRLKVFFRSLLAIPALIVASLLGNGLLLLSPILWLVTLIGGRMPQDLFSAAAAAIRYQARLSAYYGLLTDVYPQGAFGDTGSPVAAAKAHRELRLPLSTDAKRYVALLLVLGVVAWIGEIVPQIDLSSSPTSSPVLSAAATRFEAATLAWVTAEKDCAHTAKAIRCLQPKERAWSNAFDEFASAVSSVRFSGSQQAEANAVVSDARTIAAGLLVASRAKTEMEHSQAFVQAQSGLQQFEQDSLRLLGHGF